MGTGPRVLLLPLPNPPLWKKCIASNVEEVMKARDYLGDASWLDVLRIQTEGLALKNVAAESVPIWNSCGSASDPTVLLQDDADSFLKIDLLIDRILHLIREKRFPLVEKVREPDIAARGSFCSALHVRIFDLQAFQDGLLIGDFGLGLDHDGHKQQVRGLQEVSILCRRRHGFLDCLISCCVNHNSSVDCAPSAAQVGQSQYHSAPVDRHLHLQSRQALTLGKPCKSLLLRPAVEIPSDDRGSDSRSVDAKVLQILREQIRGSGSNISSEGLRDTEEGSDASGGPNATIQEEARCAEGGFRLLPEPLLLREHLPLVVVLLSEEDWSQLTTPDLHARQRQSCAGAAEGCQKGQ
mmetsp:Transcript_5493/g.21704  ORF Transcript_5493/g.21704 Transcript_5493/m.21704 type:complete len:353 (+) Transcript_5493:595-1653(+)